MRLIFEEGLLALSFLLPHSSFLLAQSDSLGPYGQVVQTWIALRASPGREAYAMERVRSLSSDWDRGPLGSAVLTRGSGAPHRVVACGIDEESFVVSQINDDGYIRVHTAGLRTRPRSWNGSHVGQRIIIQTTDPSNASRVRAVPGVFAVRSTHLWRLGPGALSEAPTSLDSMWIDIGARSRAEVAALGVRVLDPVFRDAPDWSVDDFVVGPAASARAGCAAVAAAASQTPRSGTTTFVVSTQSAFNWAGLAAVLASLGDVDSIFIASPDSQRLGKSLKVRARFTGSLTEAISESDLQSYFNVVASAAATPTNPNPWDARITGASMRWAQPVDSLSRYAELLARLTDTYAVAGDEEPMRDVIRARVPAWARDSVRTDSAGNLILAMGPDRDTAVFVAHMDEIGFEVVREDGEQVVLRQRGGFYPWLFAGQPALLHVRTPSSERSQGCRPTSGSAIRGVFLPPDSASASAREYRAWFGQFSWPIHGAQGLKVTAYKCSTRLASGRFTARAIDDRVGSASLVFALDGISPSKLTHKVIFLWSVGEETGLEGAHAAADAWRRTVRRVYAVDTFVSSDSPLETGRFALLPIGAGAVVRALDRSSVTPPDEIDRVSRVARASGIPLQVGTTNGGNDGSVFVPYGAIDIPLSWASRYSHSPVELMDLRDLRSLSRLISALAMSRNP